MAINRTIEISANADGVKREFADLGSTLSRAFEDANTSIERANGNASSFSEIVENRMVALDQSINKVFGELLQRSQQHGESARDRLEFIQKELNLTERILRNETEKAKLAERMKFNNALQDAQDSGASSSEIGSIKQAFQSTMSGIDEEAKIKELQMRGLRERYVQHKEDSENEDGAGGGARQDTIVERSAKQAGSGFVSGYGLAGVLSISGFVAKMISEGRALDEAESTTRGLASGNISGSGSGYGMKRADFLNYASGVLQSAGSSDYDAVGNLAFEKRFSQQQGSLNSLTGSLRMEGRGRSAGEVSLEMLNFFKRSKVFNVEKGDFTQLREKLEFNNQMLSQQGQQMAEVNATTNAQIMTAFGASGIGDQRMMDYTGSINQSITNPNSDFTKAFMFRSLRRANPNAGLLDLLKVQEQGIYGEGSFGQIVGDLRESFSGDALTMSVAKAFGLKYFQAENVLGMDDEMLNRIGSKEDIEAFSNSPDGVSMRSGRGGAGVVSRRLAQVDDWFADKGKQAIYKVEEYIGAYEEGGFGGLFSAIGSDLYSGITSAITTAYEGVSEMMANSMQEATKGMMDIMQQMGILPTLEEEVENVKNERAAYDSEVEESYGSLGARVAQRMGINDVESWMEGNSSIRYAGDGTGEFNQTLDKNYFSSESSQMKALTYTLLRGALEDETIGKPLSTATSLEYGMAYMDSPEFKAKQAQFDKGEEMLYQLIVMNNSLEQVASALSTIEEVSREQNISMQDAAKKVYNDVYKNE